MANDLTQSFASLHHWDMQTPVPIGGGVDALLDGSVEQVLMRLRPSCS